MNNNLAGAVVMTDDYDVLCAWVISALKKQQPDSHGSKYTQRFIAKKINETFSICFYVITGYSEAAENIASEHAFFSIDEFLCTLQEDKLCPEKYIGFIDTGNKDDNEDTIGLSTIKKGVKHYHTSLAEIRNIRATIDKDGKVIWKL
jgi:hypothetical protein